MGSWVERTNSKAVNCTGQAELADWETKHLKPLAVKFCGGCGGGRNSQSYKRVPWRGPLDPRMYTTPSTWESALVGSD